MNQMMLPIQITIDVFSCSPSLYFKDDQVIYNIKHKRDKKVFRERKDFKGHI